MIRLSKSIISGAEKKAVMEVLDREFLGMGQEVLNFENELKHFFSRPVVCVVNGTAALHLACQAIGLNPGDEVLVPSLTFVSSFQAISATGAKPISCDISEDTLTLNCRDIEKRITNRTKAIMPVHYAGGVGDIDNILSIAKQNDLRVIEDASHAFGTKHNGAIVGTFGDIACFSFDGIKNITSGEGGCIVSSDTSIIKKISDARLLGVENDSEKRYSGQRSWDFDVKNQGWRYHMSDLMAAIGIKQLERFDNFKNKRQFLAKYYDQIFFENKFITPLKHDYSNVVPHIYVVKIKGLKNREELRDYLFKEGIQTGIHWKPNHMLSLYRNNDLPPLIETERLYPTLITLPLHPDLKEKDLDFICEKLINFINKNL